MEKKDIAKVAVQVFDDVTKDTGAVLMNPGSEGLYVLLGPIIETLTEKRIIESLSRSFWPKDQNFTKSEFLSLTLVLAEEVKKTVPGDDETEPGTDVSKQQAASVVLAEEVTKTDAGDDEAEPGADVPKQQVSSESVKQAEPDCSQDCLKTDTAKLVIAISQRAQRNATSYITGYMEKRQPIGALELKQATLNMKFLVEECRSAL